MSLDLPTVISDLDGRIAAIDSAIRTAGVAYQFYYEAPTEKYLANEEIPEVVYEIISNFTKRGFLCVYDGDHGKLRISWDKPNMTSLDVSNISRAYPALISNLGAGFPASLIYLCLTNGVDLRRYSNSVLRDQISHSVQKSAVLGNKNITLAFAGVPAASIISLFSTVFDELNASGYGVSYSSSMGAFVISWDDGTPMEFRTGGALALASLS